MKQKPILAISIVMTIALLCTACSEAGTALYRGTPEADMVTVNIAGEPPELNSMLTTDSLSSNIFRLSMSGLIKLDANDQPQFDIAESCEISSDKKTYTFHLRHDAKWSNGEAVTAADFIYSWNYILNAENAAPFAFLLYENIKNGQEIYEGKAPASELGVTAPDDYTLVVELAQPMPYALTLFAAVPYLPVNQKAFEAIGEANYGKNIDTIVTNGPYTLSEWVHDDHIILSRNEAHYNIVDIPNIRFTMIKDANAAMNAFKAGEIDSTNITGEQMLEFENENSQILKSYYDNGTWFLRFNTKTELLSNPKIRLALGMAIDLQLLCDNVLKDGSTPANGFVPPQIAGAEGKFYADARGDVYTPDINTAKSLWEEGLKELGKTPSEITLRYLADDTSYSKLQAEFFQAQWKTNLGIDVTIDTMPFKARLAATNNGDFDIVFGGWSPDFNDPLTFLSLLTSNSGNNTGNYQSPQYDSLIANAMAETDVVKRQELLIEAEKLLMDDAPIVPLYFSCVPYVVSSKLTGMTRTGFQEYDFCDGAKIAE